MEDIGHIDGRKRLHHRIKKAEYTQILCTIDDTDR